MEIVIWLLLGLVTVVLMFKNSLDELDINDSFEINLGDLLGNLVAILGGLFSLIYYLFAEYGKGILEKIIIVKVRKDTYGDIEIK